MHGPAGSGTDLVQAGDPEVCTAEEEDQNEPQEPGIQLTVAVYGCAQQCGKSLAEQDALGANHATEKGVADRQGFHPAR